MISSDPLEQILQNTSAMTNSLFRRSLRTIAMLALVTSCSGCLLELGIGFWLLKDQVPMPPGCEDRTYVGTCPGD